jgi:predicted DNA-binding transcriptional regulator AlpA
MNPTNNKVKEVILSPKNDIASKVDAYMQNRWLTPENLEEEYGIKESTQGKMRMQRRIPYHKIGQKFIRYDRYKIDEWLEDHEVVPYER